MSRLQKEKKVARWGVQSKPPRLPRSRTEASPRPTVPPQALAVPSPLAAPDLLDDEPPLGPFLDDDDDDPDDGPAPAPAPARLADDPERRDPVPSTTTSRHSTTQSSGQ